MRKARTDGQQKRRDYIVAKWREESDAEMADALDTTRVNVAMIRRRLGFNRDSQNIKALHAHGRNKEGWQRHKRDWTY